MYKRQNSYRIAFSTKYLLLALGLSCLLAACGLPGLDMLSGNHLNEQNLSGSIELNSVTRDLPTCTGGQEISEAEYRDAYPPYQQGQSWLYDTDFQLSGPFNGPQRMGKSGQFLIKNYAITYDAKSKEDGRVSYLATYDPDMITAAGSLDGAQDLSRDLLMKHDGFNVDFGSIKPRDKGSVMHRLHPMTFDQRIVFLSSGHSGQPARIFYRLQNAPLNINGKTYPAQLYCTQTVLDAQTELSTNKARHYFWVSPQHGLVRSVFHFQYQPQQDSDLTPPMDIRSEMRLQAFTPGSGPQYTASRNGLDIYIPEEAILSSLADKIQRKDAERLADCQTAPTASLQSILSLYPAPEAGQERHYGYISYAYDPSMQRERVAPGLLSHYFEAAQASGNLAKRTVDTQKPYPTLPAQQNSYNTVHDVASVNFLTFTPQLPQPGQNISSVQSLGTERVTVDGVDYDTQRFCLQLTENAGLLNKRFDYLGWFAPGVGVVKSVHTMKHNNLETLTTHVIRLAKKPEGAAE